MPPSSFALLLQFCFAPPVQFIQLQRVLGKRCYKIILEVCLLPRQGARQAFQLPRSVLLIWLTRLSFLFFPFFPTVSDSDQIILGTLSNVLRM